MAVQNEARRGQRRRAPDAPVPPEIACQVIPIGDEAPCPRRGTGENPRVCEDHRLDHQRLYFAYKHASAKAKQLCAQLAVDPDLRRGASLSEERLRRAIERREEYERAIDAELGGREMHRQRFNLDGEHGCMKPGRRWTH
ncbi:hypothetical protein BC628DRAFT_779489 [Trametes gibbosa]|nr:hypothetical protein BC628DRAFT_779489 [Trametes gibbosa]